MDFTCGSLIPFPLTISPIILHQKSATKRATINFKLLNQWAVKPGLNSGLGFTPHWFNCSSFAFLHCHLRSLISIQQYNDNTNNNNHNNSNMKVIRR